jgi:hypothetical protein
MEVFGGINSVGAVFGPDEKIGPQTFNVWSNDVYRSDFTSSQYVLEVV